ncbi:hypothetical protein PP714_03825 [Lacticaseibacillus paracasei]|nr:hypothetical protein [Lacticaseibacillus paracasei]
MDEQLSMRLFYTEKSRGQSHGENQRLVFFASYDYVDRSGWLN